MQCISILNVCVSQPTPGHNLPMMHSINAMHLHFECQCLSTNSMAYPLDEVAIASALPRTMATEIC